MEAVGKALRGLSVGLRQDEKSFGDSHNEEATRYNGERTSEDNRVIRLLLK